MSDAPQHSVKLSHRHVLAGTLATLAVGLAGLMLTLAVFSWVRTWEMDRLQTGLEKNASAYHALIQFKLQSFFSEIDATRRFFNGSEVVDRDEFAAFVQPVMRDKIGAEAFYWAPRVTAAERTAFENTPWKTGLGGRAIHEHTTRNQQETVPAPYRSTYYPITYIEPEYPDDLDISYDLGAEDSRRATLEFIIDSGTAQLFANIYEINEMAWLHATDTNQSVIIQPVYSADTVPQTTDARRALFRGFILLQFNLGDAVEFAIKDITAGGIDFNIRDLLSSGKTTVLYHHHSRMGGKSLLDPGQPGNPDDGLQSVMNFDIPGQHWDIVFAPVESYYSQHRQWQSWYTLAFGLLLSAVLTYGVHTNLRRRAIARALIEKRTYELIESENRQRTILGSISDIFFTLTSDWKFRYINPKGEALFEQSQAHLAGKDIWEEFPELASFFHRPISTALNKQKTVIEDALYYPPQNKWFDLRAYPISDGVAVYLLDATKAVRDQRSREQAEARVRAVIETAVDGIITINERGIVETFNPAAEQIFGYSAAEVIDNNVSMLMPDPYRSEHDEYLHHHIRTGEKKIIGLGREVTGMRKNGDTFPMDLAVSEIIRDEIRHFVGIVRDITERKRNEEQIIHSQKMDSLGKLTGGVAHEFNNMLTTIGGFAHMARDKQDDPERVSRALEKIIKASDQAATLTRKLLVFSRKQALEYQVVPVNEIVQDLADMTAPLLGNDINLKITGDSEIAHIHVDPGQLTQALLNLAINARDAMPNGGDLIISHYVVDELPPDLQGKHPEVTARPLCMLSIHDTGTGISKKNLERIFEPFFTTKGVQKGTGLGLAMVYGMVKQSGGIIDVSSKLDHGTTFSIYFPWIDVQADLTHPTDQEAMSRDVPPPGGDEHILLAEDEADVREYITATLNDLGYRVTTASDGIEALDIYRSAPSNFDLVISDIAMPRMNGIEFGKALLADDAGRRLMLISANAADDEIQHLASAKRFYFMRKPFEYHAFAQRIRDLLDMN